MIYIKHLKQLLFDALITEWYLQECKNYKNDIIEDVNVNWYPIKNGYNIYLYDENGIVFYREDYECETALQMFKRARLLKRHYERIPNIRKNCN